MFLNVKKFIRKLKQNTEEFAMNSKLTVSTEEKELHDLQKKS